MKNFIRYFLSLIVILLIILLVFIGGYYIKNSGSATVKTITINNDFSVILANPKNSAEAAAIIVATQKDYFTEFIQKYGC